MTKLSEVPMTPNLLKYDEQFVTLMDKQTDRQTDGQIDILKLLSCQSRNVGCTEGVQCST